MTEKQEIEDAVEGSAEDRAWLELTAHAPQTSLDACTRGSASLLKVLAVLIPAQIALEGAFKMNTLYSTLAVYSWVLAMVLALGAMLPTTWRFKPGRVSSIRDGYQKMVIWKLRLTRRAFFFTTVGLFLAVAAKP